MSFREESLVKQETVKHFFAGKRKRAPEKAAKVVKLVLCVYLYYYKGKNEEIHSRRQRDGNMTYLMTPAVQQL